MAVSLEIEPRTDTPSLAVVRMDRPPVNALDDATKLELLRVTAELAARDDVGAVIVHGGPVFCAGDDIKEMAGLPQDHAQRGNERISEVCAAVEALPMPVIAAVTGFALGGGCELALAADFRITAADASWGLPEIALGLIPAGGGTQRLPRLIGAARAKQLIFFGRTLTGDDAVAWGLADAAVPSSSVLSTARAWASDLLDQAPLALRAAKRAVDAAGRSGVDGLQLESALFADVFASEDAATGVASFVERGPGKARFVGR